MQCLHSRPDRRAYLNPPYWQTEGYGVEFGFEQYGQISEVMRICKGKVMLSINDHPDIRKVFNGFNMMGLDIKYSLANANAKQLSVKSWSS